MLTCVSGSINLDNTDLPVYEYKPLFIEDFLNLSS